MYVGLDPIQQIQMPAFQPAPPLALTGPPDNDAYLVMTPSSAISSTPPKKRLSRSAPNSSKGKSLSAVGIFWNDMCEFPACCSCLGFGVPTRNQNLMEYALHLIALSAEADVFPWEPTLGPFTPQSQSEGARSMILSPIIAERITSFRATFLKILISKGGRRTRELE